LLAVVGLLPAAAYGVLLAATQRQSQRAEYGADVAGAAVAGRQAMVAALSTVMEGDALVLAMRRTAMGAGRADVLDAVRAEGQRLAAADWPGRQNRHRNGPFDSHPPDHLRRGLVQTLPESAPALVLDQARAARIDAELGAVRAWASRRVYDSFQAH
jgi:Zn-dependent protease with chaperone function